MRIRVRSGVVAVTAAAGLAAAGLGTAAPALAAPITVNVPCQVAALSSAITNASDGDVRSSPPSTVLSRIAEVTIACTASDGQGRGSAPR